MTVIVDTSVWSLVLRRPSPDPVRAENLGLLISQSQVVMIGPIRQELLSGIKNKSQFNKLRSYLSAFPDQALDSEVYETAAEFFNKCRAKGVTGSHIDFLICSAGYHCGATIYTSDPDFDHYTKYLPISKFTENV